MLAQCTPPLLHAHVSTVAASEVVHLPADGIASGDSGHAFTIEVRQDDSRAIGLPLLHVAGDGGITGRSELLHLRSDDHTAVATAVEADRPASQR